MTRADHSQGEVVRVEIQSPGNVADGFGKTEDGGHVHVVGDVEVGRFYSVKLVDDAGGYWVGEPVESTNHPHHSSSQGGRVVFVVQTGKAYCYHRDSECSKLQKREGEFHAYEIDKSLGEVPKPVSEKRPCPVCC